MTTVVPVSQIRHLPEVQREQAVTLYLATARDRLHDAMEATAVVSIKAEVATVAEMTKQLGLSKECRDDATEMVRRAEYALGKAVRRGQADGSIASRGSFGNGRSATGADLIRPTDLASDAELYGNSTTGSPGIVDLADATDSESEFENALTTARKEGNLSRRNVVRKVKGQKSGETRQERADIIRDMAAEGHHRDQVARHLGIGREAVNNIARDYGISFPADAVGNVRRADSARIVRETVNTLEGLLLALPLVKVEELDPTEANDWTASLDQSLRALNRFNKKIKEAVL